MTRKRALLLTVAALLCVSALLAIGILLVGRFGSTEGRILGSTALLAGFGVLALPAVVLLDQGRARTLARASIACVSVGTALSLVAVWGPSGSDTLGRAVGSVVVAAVALSQVCALTARRVPTDPTAVRMLFDVSSVTAALAAVLATVLIWSNPHGSLGPRVLGAVVVLDLLLVALQPLLARARPQPVVHRFAVVLRSGERVDVAIEGGDVASAAARAIRSVEGRGPVVELDLEREGVPE